MAEEKFEPGAFPGFGGDFDPSKMPADFDFSKMPPFDPSKMPADFDFSKMPPFDPSKMPADFDPSKMPPFDPSKMPAPPFFGMEEEEEEETTEDNNVLHQKNPGKWLKQHPKQIRGNMRNAFKVGREADMYKCNCWNRKCPFFGDCRKCIAFHMALKQLPTCQRDMVIELYKSGALYEELYIKEELEREAAEKAAAENKD